MMRAVAGARPQVPPKPGKACTSLFWENPSHRCSESAREAAAKLFPPGIRTYHAMYWVHHTSKGTVFAANGNLEKCQFSVRDGNNSTCNGVQV